MAVLAHELRNPLAPIRNSAAVLSQLLSHNATQLSLVDIVHRQCTQLTRLVDDLLDVARITQGRIELRRDAVSIASCVELAIETVQPLIREKNHRLEVTRSESLYVTADNVRLAQCIANLLTNAAKYTEPGGQIRIRTHAYGREAVVEVSDDGVGISAELLPRVFEPFVQNERPLDRSEGGLGIGLSICKQLVELHGGSVAGASEGPGQGATFTIRLPLAQAPVDSPGRNSVEGKSRRVLIVDDNRDAANSLAMLLNLEGYQTTTAYSAEEALKEAVQFDPQIVLLDIGLPHMNGYEVAQRIKGNGSSARIVALSGYGQAEDRRRSAEAGFDAHLIKPVEMTALNQVLAVPDEVFVDSPR